MNAYDFNEKFPSEMKEIKQKVKEKGFDPSKVFEIHKEDSYYRVFLMEDQYLYEAWHGDAGWTEVRVEKE